MAYHPFFKKRFYLFIFRGRGREGEREKHVLRETLIGCLSHTHPPKLGTWPETQACALTGNRTCDLLFCWPALSLLSYISQGMNGIPFLIFPAFLDAWYHFP